MVARELEPLNISIRCWRMDRCVDLDILLECMFIVSLLCCNQKQKQKAEERRRANKNGMCLKYTKIERIWRSWFPSIVKKRCTAIIRILCSHGHYIRQTVDATRHTVPRHWERCRASNWRRNEHQNDLCDTWNRNSYRWSGSLQSLSERCRGQRRSTLQKRKIDLRFVYLFVVYPHGME